MLIICHISAIYQQCPCCFSTKGLHGRKTRKMFRVGHMTYQIRVHVEVQLKAADIHNSIVQACKALHLLQAEDRENKTLTLSFLSWVKLLSH